MIINKGDNVKCIDVDGVHKLSLNNVYKVLYVNDRDMICVINDYNDKDIYFKKRFELDISSIRKYKLKKIYEKERQ
jgi:hypothetical protein